jgi:hypothetical protein
MIQSMMGRVCGDPSRSGTHLTGVVGELVYAIQFDEKVDDLICAYGDGGGTSHQPHYDCLKRFQLGL